MQEKEGKLQSYEEKRKKTNQFQLTSDVFFSKAMEDKLACQEVIRILTQKNLTVKEVKTQYSIRNMENRSVVLDVLTEAEDSRIVNVEMHLREDEDHVKRVRYHLSCIDVSFMEKGTQFEEVPEVFLIYITDKDFIGIGRSIYAVDRVIRDIGQILDNGVHELYVNFSGKSDIREQQELLNYMVKSESGYDTKTFPHLVNRVKLLKEDKEVIDIMCDIIDRERAEGKLEGESIKLISQVRKKRDKNITPEECADILEEKAYLIQQIYTVLQNHSDWDDDMVFHELKTMNIF